MTTADSAIPTAVIPISRPAIWHWRRRRLPSELAEQAWTLGNCNRLRDYIDAIGGREALKQRYGKDKTFVVPILTNLAIAGLVDWDDVAALPFEAAVFPQSMYRLLQMPVVSYAIPALVAIGQAQAFSWQESHRAAALDSCCRDRSDDGCVIADAARKRRLFGSNPVDFVCGDEFGGDGACGSCGQSAAVCGFWAHRCATEGSWPIDTNLATWVTSLAIHALACDPDDDGAWCSDTLVHWHLSCQHSQRHPFTGAEPGGWGWSDLSGAVPDSDDTPAAILALHQLRRWWIDESDTSRIDAVD